MKSYFVFASMALLVLPYLGCDHPVQRVQVPSPNDPSAYQPQAAPKPLPPEVTGAPQEAPPPPPPAPGMPTPAPGGPGAAAPAGQPPMPQPPVPVAPNAAQIASMANGLPEEEPFVQAYEAHRRPRMMVFVNRNILGDPLPKDNLEQLIHATTPEARAEAEKYDDVGATAADYAKLELSLIDYLNCGGRVQMMDPESVRGKLDREKVLRLENGDPAALKLLATELQTDVLIQLRATPTRHSQWPQGALALNLKAVSTADGRILATEFVDMPLPLSKPNVNVFTRYLAEKTMIKLMGVWSGNPVWDPLELRIYKAASVDDTLAVRSFIKKLPHVSSVTNHGATSGKENAYASFSVAYSGAPEDFYEELRDSIKVSRGLKAIDLQHNTVSVEITGALELKPVASSQPVAGTQP
jgi:hypothetical protein